MMPATREAVASLVTDAPNLLNKLNNPSFIYAFKLNYHSRQKLHRALLCKEKSSHFISSLYSFHVSLTHLYNTATSQLARQQTND